MYVKKLYLLLSIESANGSWIHRAKRSNRSTFILKGNSHVYSRYCSAVGTLFSCSALYALLLFGLRKWASQTKAFPVVDAHFPHCGSWLHTFFWRQWVYAPASLYTLHNRPAAAPARMVGPRPECVLGHKNRSAHRDGFFFWEAYS